MITGQSTYRISLETKVADPSLATIVNLTASEKEWMKVVIQFCDYLYECLTRVD